jgi:hypothetical protein
VVVWVYRYYTVNVTRNFFLENQNLMEGIWTKLTCCSVAVGNKKSKLLMTHRKEKSFNLFEQNKVRPLSTTLGYLAAVRWAVGENAKKQNGHNREEGDTHKN